MAQSPKIWRKKNGQWVKTTPDVTKADVGLGNVENFTHTNSATDGSSSKYATGSAVKQAYDRASAALSKANQGLQVGGVQLAPPFNSYISHYWKWKDNQRSLAATGDEAMRCYTKVAKDRNDTLLTGVYRRSHRARDDENRIRIQVRVYYRRIL